MKLLEDEPTIVLVLASVYRMTVVCCVIFAMTWVLKLGIVVFGWLPWPTL